jgi:MoaA/NifB/PqqE/SkfB family radical SAM enzyme
LYKTLSGYRGDGDNMSKYVDLNRLEYIVTYQCSSHCRHCYATGEESSGPNHIGASLAVHILREAARKHTLNSVMTFGGEPLLYPEVVCAIHEEAMTLDVPRRHVITNGYWTRDEGKTRALAQSLARAGVNEVYISVDAFHQEYVSLEWVKCSAAALWDAGIRDIKWNPCWLAARDGANEYDLETRAILDGLQGCLPIEVGHGNVMEPEGRALDNFGTYFRTTFDWSRTSCEEIAHMSRLDDIRSLCVELSGDILICGSLLGNALHDDFSEILEAYDPYRDPHTRLILEEGIAGIVREARLLGLELREEGYYSICDLCTSLRQEMAEAVCEHA